MSILLLEEQAAIGKSYADISFSNFETTNNFQLQADGYRILESFRCQL